MNTDNLSEKSCAPCEGGMDAMSAEAVRDMLAQVAGWEVSADATAIFRRFAFKGIAKAVEMANLAAWLGNKQSHHPDICFGWGYCTVTFTTHDAKGLTENDFICAARLNALIA